MATVIAAVGEESAPPGAVDSILSSATLALSAGSSEDAVARECAFRCFGRLATVLERSLAPWLGGAIAAAAATLAAAEATRSRRDFNAAVSRRRNESIAAAEALGALVNSCGFATRPHLAVALAALGRAASSPSSPVALRVASARSLEFSLRPLEESDGGGGGDGDGYQKSAPGDGDGDEKGTGTPPPPPRGISPRETVTLLARLVTEDEEPEVASPRRRRWRSRRRRLGGWAPRRRRRRRRRGGVGVARRVRSVPGGSRGGGRVGRTGRTPGRCSSTSRTRREG